MNLMEGTKLPSRREQELRQRAGQGDVPLVLEAVDYLPQQAAIRARGPSPVEAVQSAQARPALVRFRCLRRQRDPAGGARGAPYKFERAPATGAKFQRLHRGNRLPATGTGGRIEKEEEFVREPAKEGGRAPEPGSKPLRGPSTRRATLCHLVTPKNLGVPPDPNLKPPTGPRAPLLYAFPAICSMIAAANSEQRTSRAPAICRAKS